MIFVHSSFRVSSTYIWSKLRGCTDTLAYYEIFHEVMPNLTRASIGAITPASWYSKHPKGASYLLEFLPLLRDEGGVSGSDPSFSFEKYIPKDGPGGQISDREAAYIHGLIEHAEQSGKIPILTATRSLGRVAGIKAAAPGFHVLLYRNLYQQWCSCSEQAYRNNSYFINWAGLVLPHAEHDPFLRNIVDLFPVSAASERDVNTFYQFIFAHIYLYAHAACAADLIVDVNQLADDLLYRRDIEERFRAQALSLDFSDATNTIAFSLLDVSDREGLRECMKVVGDIILATVPSEVGRKFGAKVIRDFFSEFERNEFHARPVRTILRECEKDRDLARTACADVQATEATLRSELEAAVTAAHEARGHRDRSDAERDAAQSAATEAVRSREAAILERDVARAAEVAAEQACTAAIGERDAARHSEVATRRSFDTTIAELDALNVASTEANRLHALADKAAEAAAIGARQREASALAKLDEAQASAAMAQRERDTALADRSAAHATLVAATAEQERLRARYRALLSWSVAYHDSTAASASWRLTRPLRWLGIGRPKRPERPDFSAD